MWPPKFSSLNPVDAVNLVTSSLYHYKWTCRCNVTVYPDGKVCISILHTPGDDPTGYESSSERWSPVQSVEKILLSVLSMLAGKHHVKIICLLLGSYFAYTMKNMYSIHVLGGKRIHSFIGCRFTVQFMYLRVGYFNAFIWILRDFSCKHNAYIQINTLYWVFTIWHTPLEFTCNTWMRMQLIF